MSTNYIERVKSIRKGDLMAYWPLNEEAGTVALDHGPSGYNGTSASIVRVPATRGVLAPDGGKCAQFDGSATVVNVYNSFSSTIAVAEGTVQAWVAVPSSALAGTSAAQIVMLGADSANQIGMTFDSTAYRFSCVYYAGSGDATYSTTNSQLVYNDPYLPQFPKWHHLAMTYSAAADAVILYVDGVASTACASLGAWVGAWGSTLTCIGSAKSSLGTLFTGWMSHVAWWKSPLTAAEIKDLYEEVGP